MPDFLQWVVHGTRLLSRAVNLVASPPAPPAEGKSRGRPHPRPERASPVPVRGRPYYLAGLTIGGPVADFGSHAGVKAAVTPAGGASGRDLLETAHYPAFTTVSSKVDRSRLRLGDGLALERVEVEFHPWGWRESARGAGGLEAEGEVATVALDAFLFVARVSNRGAASALLRPRLEFLDDPDPVDEAQQPMRFSRGGRWQARAAGGGGAAIAYRRRSGPGPLAFDDTRFVRRIAASFGPLDVRVSRPRFECALSGAPLALEPGATATLHALVGCGETDEEAEASLRRGEERLEAAGGAEGALAAVRADWERFLAAIPAPADATPEDRRTLEVAATGLRMSECAPRGRMPCRSTYPSKVHFNLFANWDLCFHALGLKEWDPALAKDTLAMLLAGQREDGIICYGVGSDLEPMVPLIERVSQPPAAGLAVLEVFEADGARDRAWLEAQHERLLRYARWWERERDPDGDGLFSWHSAIETGWDDTPRLPNPRVPPIPALGLDLGNLSGLLSAARFAAVDLNAWMYTLYESLAAIARHLGREADAADATARAERLAGRIEAVLWDESRGGYFDREVAPDGTPGAFTRAVTPAVAWPLFAGLVRDPARAARVVEGFLLDPAKLFGDPDDPAAPRWPVPTVAYDDPGYDHAEDGYYWRGQVWLIPSYAVLTALHRYGYAREAETLRRRLLRLVAGASDGGIFETYDALTGAIGFGSGSLSGPGEPACFQIGLSTAVAALVALRAYERYPVVAREPARSAP